jgi:hypothetical protein
MDDRSTNVADLFTDDAAPDLGVTLTGVDAIRVAMQARAAANTERRTTQLLDNLTAVDPVTVRGVT